MTKREILADGLLLLTALIWGCAFSVVKNALDSFPPGAIIAMRYLIAAAITGALAKSLTTAEPKNVSPSFSVGS